MRQCAVIGLGEFGRNVALSLAESDVQVIGIDVNKEVIEEVADKLTNAVAADATDEKTLRKLGVQDVDVAIVAVGSDFEASIQITMLLKELAVKEIIVKANSESQAKVLKSVGATRVIQPEKDMGVRLAKSLASPRIIDHIELFIDYSLLEMTPPKEFVGKSLKQLELRVKHGIDVIAVKHENEETDIVPSANYVIKENDLLVVIGRDKDIERIKKKA